MNWIHLDSSSQIAKWALSTEITRSLGPIIRSDFLGEFQSIVDTETFNPNAILGSIGEAFSFLEGGIYSDDA